MNEGIIYDIQRYSIHDGPGIRSTVFFKGCPLDCWWCHNPESSDFRPQLVFWTDKCIACRRCVDACPNDILPDGASASCGCVLCGRCSEACPAGAVELVGQKWTVAQVIEHLKRDTVFYDESGGGITFSGGEPLGQPDFLLDLLAECRRLRLHTAVDTSGYADWDAVKEVARAADMLLWDVKLLDDDSHSRYVGVSNEPILANLQRLVHGGFGERIVARFPLIPGINDDENNLREMGKLLRCLNINRLNILPYHETATEKYARLNSEYRLCRLAPPEDDHVEAVRQRFEGWGIHTEIGG